MSESLRNLRRVKDFQGIKGLDFTITVKPNYILQQPVIASSNYLLDSLKSMLDWKEDSPRPDNTQLLVMHITELTNIKSHVTNIPLEILHIQSPRIRQFLLPNLHKASEICTRTETIVQQITSQGVQYDVDTAVVRRRHDRG